MRLFTKLVALIAIVALPMIAIARPQRRDTPAQSKSNEKKQPSKSGSDSKGKSGSADRTKEAPKASPEGKDDGDRTEAVRSRMKARDREIDRIMNKDKGR